MLPWRIDLNLPRPHDPVIARRNKHLLFPAPLRTGIISLTPSYVVNLEGPMSSGLGSNESPCLLLAFLSIGHSIAVVVAIVIVPPTHALRCYLDFQTTLALLLPLPAPYSSRRVKAAGDEAEVAGLQMGLPRDGADGAGMASGENAVGGASRERVYSDSLGVGSSD
ncbi:hypothetical protein HG530_000902 [Fusarium avenaceum]|nr:hypothetical protein HG530_000902 [Fusarium avenaceum]